MIKDEPPDQTIAIQQFGESETLLGTRNGTNDMLSLISKFLESAGNVLLVQGPPGAGKTTLALELLRRVQATRMGSTVVPPARFYVPSRVSPNKLRKHFPWIHDMHDPLSKNTSRENSIEGSAEIRVSDADDVFNTVLTRQRQVQAADEYAIRERFFKEATYPLTRSPHGVFLLNRESRPRSHAQGRDPKGLLDLDWREQYRPYHGSETSP